MKNLTYSLLFRKSTLPTTFLVICIIKIEKKNVSPNFYKKIIRNSLDTEKASLWLFPHVFSTLNIYLTCSKNKNDSFVQHFACNEANLDKKCFFIFYFHACLHLFKLIINDCTHDIFNNRQQFHDFTFKNNFNKIIINFIYTSEKLVKYHFVDVKREMIPKTETKLALQKEFT